MPLPNAFPYDWKNIIEELTPGEDAILQERLTHPVVVKFLKNLAYMAMIDQSMTPIDLMKKDGSQATLIDMAYYKGNLEIIDHILTHLKDKGDSHGTS